MNELNSNSLKLQILIVEIPSSITQTFNQETSPFIFLASGIALNLHPNIDKNPQIHSNSILNLTNSSLNEAFIQNSFIENSFENDHKDSSLEALNEPEIFYSLDIHDTSSVQNFLKYLN